MRILEFTKPFLSTFLATAALVSAGVRADSYEVVNPNDTVMLFIDRLASAEVKDTQVVLKLAYCLGPKECRSFWDSPVLDIKARASDDYSQRPLVEKRSKVFGLQNLRSAFADVENYFKLTPGSGKPQIAVRAVRLENGKEVEKSAPYVTNFPPLSQAGRVQDQQIHNHVNITLRGLTIDATLVIQRK